MMKRFLSVFLVLAMLLSCGIAQAAPESMVIVINGVEAAFTGENGEQLPTALVEGRLYAPAVALGEKLSLEVAADPASLAVHIAGRRTTFKSGGTTVAPVVIEGVVYVPVLPFVDTLNDCDVDIVGNRYMITCQGAMYYQRGVEALRLGEYDKARTVFKQAGSFADAATRIYEAYYLEAEALLKSGEYAAASASFQNAGSYQDAASRVGEPYYVQGQKLQAEGKLEEASAAYKEAGQYQDAAALAVQLSYSAAEKKLQSGDHAGAYKAYVKAGVNKETRQKLLEIFYLMAEKYISAGQNDKATAYYELAGEYAGAQEKLKAAYYAKAQAAEAAGKTQDAIDIYKSVGSYQDAQDKWQKLTYNLAKQKVSSQKYDEAYALFDTIRGYSDVDNRLSVNTGLKNAAKKAQAAALVKGISTGDTFTFGNYVLVDSGNSKKQPVQWQVLRKDGSKILLVSKYVVDKKPYNSSNNKSINWSNCTLRTWLNGTFMQNAFTQSERNTIVSNSNSSQSVNSSYIKTNDKVFLLTYNETQNYISQDNRIAKTAKGVKVNTWTRDRYTRLTASSHAYGVIVGSGGSSGYDKVTVQYYLRPAMWVNLEANYDWSKCITVSSASNQYSDIKLLMSRGAYELAMEKLNKEAASTEVTELTRECRYQLGCEALRNGDLTNATQYFNLLKRFQYKNTVELLSLIDTLK